MVVTSVRLKDARVRKMLVPVYKSVIRKQNFFENFLKDITKFDAQNPIIGSLLSEIESRKLTDESVKNFLGKAQNLKGIELNQKLQNLKFCNNKLQLNNNNDNDSSDYFDNDGGFLSPPAQLIQHSSNSNPCF